MSRDVVSDLFDEFAVRYGRGERPDVREYLRRAGPVADELAALLDRFLQAAPALEPGPEELAAARAWVAGESPLLELRTRRGLSRAGVVDALVKTLALDPKQREKVRRRYHELETGLLDEKRVDQRVWDALAATLGARIDALRGWTRRAAPFPAAPAYFRAETAELGMAAEVASRLPPEEPDEIDRLFGLAK